MLQVIKFFSLNIIHEINNINKIIKIWVGPCIHSDIEDDDII